jgi:hypothetical protein
VGTGLWKDILEELKAIWILTGWAWELDYKPVKGGAGNYVRLKLRHLTKNTK